MIVVITGQPASGKTTLAHWLENEIGWPLICKDHIKETMFDHIGWSDRAWSRKVGMASITILFQLLERLVKANISCIVESNFTPHFDSSRFQNLVEQYGIKITQLLCTAPGEILFQRFMERADTDQRHPGHVELDHMEEFKARLLGDKVGFLHVQGAKLEVDITNTV